MIRNAKLTAAALLAAATVLPATAHAADAFTSFNATQGAGGFFYGLSASPITPLDQFSANTNCFIPGSICLQQSANFSVPGVTKSVAPSQFGTVIVPADRLLLHPGADSQFLLALYQVATTGTYTVTGQFSVQDVSPTGVNVSFLTSLNNTLPYTLAPVSTLSSANLNATFSQRLTLTAGDVIGFAFDNAGNFSNDSTGLNFDVSAVPEPASWAMMIGGVGLVGGALRRRKGAVRTTVSFA